MKQLSEQLNILKPDPVELLRNGIAAAKTGNREEARSLLMEAAELDPYNELPWLWLAWVSETPKAAVYYVKKALEINPNSKQANEWLSKLEQYKEPESAVWHCPLCEISLQTEAAKCPRCRAVLSLNDIDALLNNPDADRNLIRQAIERLEEIPEEESTFAQLLNKGVAFLNEKRFDEGLRLLRTAELLNPSDFAFRSRLRILERKAAAAIEKASALQKQKVVLVIDDSPTVRKLAAVTLERNGYKAVVASDGMQAMTKIEESSPDLVLLDINMPYMDGHQVCKLIKSRDAAKQVTIVMLSGKDGFIDKVRSRMSGASEFISKPVDPNILLNVVHKYLRSKDRM